MAIDTSIRLLIAEDDTTFIKALATYLGRDRSRDIILAKDGADALRALKRSAAVDIALVDLVMPGMDGIELLRKTLEKSPDTLVIMMTGYGTIDTAVKAMREGAYDFKAKPFLLEEMELTVRRAEAHLRLRRDRDDLSERIGRLIAELQLKAGRIEELSRGRGDGERPERYLQVMRRELGPGEASFLYRKSAALVEDEEIALLEKLKDQGAIPSGMYRRIISKLGRSRPPTESLPQTR